MAQNKPWLIDSVPITTRNKIIACKGLLGAKTIPEALDKMADIALASLQKN
jgi:hypothetical protein